MKWINSTENPLIKEILKITKSPKEKIFLEGLNLIKTAFYKQKYHKVEKVLLTQDFISKHAEILDFLQKEQIEILGISDKIAKKISDTVTPQGIFALISYKTLPLSDKIINKPEILVILDQIQDPGNLGTIMRTAEAFGVQAIILTPGCCNPLLSKSIRASAGSLFFIPIIHAEVYEIKDFIKKNSLRLILTEPKGRNLIFKIEFNLPLAIVFGNEAHGVSDYFKKMPHISCRIPHVGRSESLNVAMSASIILYEVFKNKAK